MQVDRARRARCRARSPASTVPSSRPVPSSTSRTGGPPLERMSARSLARRRSVQYQPCAPAAQQPGLGQRVDAVAGPRTEQRQVVLGQRQLRGGRAQVRAEDVGVVGVEHVGLDRRPEQRLGVVHQVGVQRVVAGDQHAQRVLAAAPGAADLLPQRRPGAGEAGHQHRVEAGDVDAELEGVGGREPDQLARTAAPARARAGPRAGSRRGRPRPGRRSSGATSREQPAGGQRDRLGAAPGPDERQRAHALDDQVGQQVGGLGGRGPPDRRAVLARAAR